MHGGTWRATTAPSRGNKLFPTATYLFFKLLMIDQDFPHRLIPAFPDVSFSMRSSRTPNLLSEMRNLKNGHVCPEKLTTLINLTVLPWL